MGGAWVLGGWRGVPIGLLLGQLLSQSGCPRFFARSIILDIIV